MGGDNFNNNIGGSMGHMGVGGMNQMGGGMNQIGGGLNQIGGGMNLMGGGMNQNQIGGGINKRHDMDIMSGDSIPSSSPNANHQRTDSSARVTALASGTSVAHFNPSLNDTVRVID